MIIAVDFDGTLCEHRFPYIGEEVPYAFETLKELQSKGHKLILWTMRDERNDNHLGEALHWCRKKGIEFWQVNENLDENWTESNKCYAHLYIDDAALGCPLRDAVDSSRPMVDWLKIRQMLKERNII